VTPASLKGHPWVFGHGFYLLINVAVGGHASVPPDSSTAFPQVMLIDYVRVYTPPVSATKHAEGDLSAMPSAGPAPAVMPGRA
jgi:beta-glucanase (GH16 family)